MPNAAGCRVYIKAAGRSGLCRFVGTAAFGDDLEGERDGVPKTLEIIQRADSIQIPFVVLAELRSGFLCGTLARRNEQYLVRFLNSNRVRVLYADESTTHHFAQVFAQLRLQGTPIPINDIWIAALAIQHDLLLYSRDAHFDNLPQIARIE